MSAAANAISSRGGSDRISRRPDWPTQGMLVGGAGPGGFAWSHWQRGRLADIGADRGCGRTRTRCRTSLARRCGVPVPSIDGRTAS